ncbi:MAG: Mov34/MPN/PAD-1 family protein [Nitrospiraceae bacterium]|nr:Mov34/MPN/PAD-1 family protein [Nitrospiraceae bacterium]
MLTQDAIQAMSDHAVADYPGECCGIVTGMGAIQRVHRCRNRQDELHARDPEQHPRTSREAYDMDRGEMERIFADAASNGEAVIAFYHSHIDCGAYFSQMDKDVQTVFGEPEFPDALQVVISVQGRRIAEITGFRWDGSKQDFVAEKIV